MTKPPPPSAASVLFPLRHRIGFALLVVAAVAAAAAAMQIYRRGVDRYQFGLTRYAAERALDALAKDDRELARQDVALLATERPVGLAEGLLFTRQFSVLGEGPVLRNRVTVYEHLTASLLKAGLPAEAEIVAWKALFEYHVVSRTIELLIPWNLLYHVKLTRSDWPSVFECAKVLAAHGVQTMEMPDRLRPVAYPFDSERVRTQLQEVPAKLQHALQVFYEADKPEELSEAARLLNECAAITANPILRGRLYSMQHRALIRAGARDQARQLLGRVWGRDPILMDPFWQVWPYRMPLMNLLDRDPTLLEYLWRDRPANSIVSINSFVDSFANDARIQIDDLTGLRRYQTGYFRSDHQFDVFRDHVRLFQNVGTIKEITLDKPVYRLYLAYSAQQALGIYPILLVKIDDELSFPIYCDSEEPALVPIDVKLSPGVHRIEFDYINDSGFFWNHEPSGFKEDRNLTLYRLVLVRIPPRE